MRLAFVTPRYGADISSGPEHACRLLAEQVCHRHDVDVLTTCARDTLTWRNEYAEGPDRVRGVLVRRFPVGQPHDRVSFAQFSARIAESPRARADEIEWARRLGPVSAGLLDHLKRQHRIYDALVFFPLQHATTVEGIKLAPERSILFPCLQLRSWLRFGLWKEILESVRAIGFLSEAERRLARQYVGAEVQTEEVVGIGIDPPPQLAYPRHQQDPADALTAEDDSTTEPPEAEPTYLSSRGVTFRRRHRLYGCFAVYGGRVEPDNGSEEMLEYFSSLNDEQEQMPLVLMGVKMMKLPDQSGVRLGAVLPDRERMAAYEAADVTIAPAADDLLAQAPLESLAVGTPVLVSARNGAAVEHCRRSNGGLYYANREEFVEAFQLLAGNTRLREALGENGRNYVRQHFRWEHVLGRFERLVARVRSR
ncbi:MAG TPA: glycosyltransferase family 4 protein [Vicinamibacterales bacterium]|nr:glycosyltransferase family 4 protein [Vicinamibacterales bacterium]